jgi:flagellar basal-body rod protein FlgB
MFKCIEERILNGLINAMGDRQQILANNLTNVNTPGYVRQDLDFGSIFSNLKKEDSNKSIDKIIEEASYRQEGTKTSYETELSEMSKNHLYYVLLTRINGGYYKTLEEATQSGRAA